MKNHFIFMWPGVRRFRKRQAFSLVDLLVSAAIFVMLVSLLGKMVSGITAAWTSTAGQNERSVSARAIMDYIHTDLKAAMLPIPAESTTSLQFVLNPPSLGSEVRNADALFWQAPVATDSTYGDLAEVGYFVRWDTSGRAPKPILCRFFLNPNEPDFRIYEDPANWLTSALLDKVAPGTAASSYAGLFAENVVAIWFRCLDRNGKAFPGRDFDSRVGKESTFETDAGGSRVLKRLPAAVQVSFVMIDSRAAVRFRGEHQNAVIQLATEIANQIDQGSPNDKTISPSELFVAAAASDEQLRKFASSLTPYTTTVHLVNAQ